MARDDRHCNREAKKPKKLKPKEIGPFERWRTKGRAIHQAGARENGLERPCGRSRPTPWVLRPMRSPGR